MENVIFENSSLINSPINEDNFKIICRICLIPTENTVPLFIIPELIQIIYQRASVQEEIQKRLPQQICSFCCNQLKNFHNFIQQYRKATTILTNIILQNEKGKLKINKNDNFENYHCKIETVKENINSEFIIKNEPNEQEEVIFIKEEIETDLFNKLSVIKNNEIVNSVKSIELENVELQAESADRNSIKNENSNSDSELIKLLTAGIINNDNTSQKIQLFSSLTKKLRPTNKNHKCNECNTTFKYQSNLERHQTKHTNEKPYECKICDRTFKTKEGLDNHTNIKHSPNAKKAMCHICGNFIFTCSINSHIESHQTVDLHCEICDKKFTRQRSFDEHMRLMHSDCVQFKHCPKCSKIFRSAGSLSSHMQRVHIKEKKHVCNICNSKFYKKSLLKMHINIKHLDIRPFVCTECDKRFHSKIILNNHMTRHTGERPYLCTTCGQTFNFSVALRTHIKLKHEKTKTIKNKQVNNVIG